jgi:hypothetical protein
MPGRCPPRHNGAALRAAAQYTPPGHAGVLADGYGVTMTLPMAPLSAAW